MFSHEDFFKILKFYDDNSTIIGAEQEIGQQPPNLIFQDDTRTIDNNIIQIAIDNKIRTEKYFKTVIDQTCFNTPDYNRLRRLIIDWHSTFRTFIEVGKKLSDPFTLDSQLLDVAIKSFGFDYSYLIQNKDLKTAFLLSLSDLYKKKGTPQSISDILKFFGFDNVAIYEWWVIKKNEQLYVEARKVDTGNDDANFPEKRTLNWQAFQQIIDSHWFYDEQKILDIDNNSAIKLPTITPYFSISGNLNLTDLNKVYSIVSRFVNDQFSYFTKTAKPLTDIQYQQYGSNISLLELYCGVLYSYWMYSDYVKYSSLKDYILQQFNIDVLNDSTPFTFEQPYSYEKLLYWCSVRTNSSGEHEPLDILGTGMPNGLTPGDGITFTPYPTDVNEVPNLNLSNDISDSILNYDNSLISHDGSVFYPNQHGLPYLQKNQSFIHNNTELLPSVGSTRITDIPDVLNVLELVLQEYDDITSRPMTRDECKQKLDDFQTNLVKLQSLNFIQHKLDPQRILSGNEPVNTMDDLPSNVFDGDVYLVRNNGEPIVVKFEDGQWQQIENGIKTENLGLNPNFKAWMDAVASGDKTQYYTIVNELLDLLDSFITNYLFRIQIDLSKLLFGVNLSTNLLPIIELFKPLRSRFIAFDLLYKIFNPHEDTVIPDDPTTILEISCMEPHKQQETIRGGIPQDYDDYVPGMDFQHVYDTCQIKIYEYNDQNELVLIDEKNW